MDDDSIRIRIDFTGLVSFGFESFMIESVNISKKYMYILFLLYIEKRRESRYIKKILIDFIFRRRKPNYIFLPFTRNRWMELNAGLFQNGYFIYLRSF